MKQICSDTCYIDKVDNPTSEYIETQLKSKFGQIVRWSVSDVTDSKLYISLAYEKEV